MGAKAGAWPKILEFIRELNGFGRCDDVAQWLNSGTGASDDGSNCRALSASEYGEMHHALDCLETCRSQITDRATELKKHVCKADVNKNGRSGHSGAREHPLEQVQRALLPAPPTEVLEIEPTGLRSRNAEHITPLTVRDLATQSIPTQFRQQHVTR